MITFEVVLALIIFHWILEPLSELIDHALHKPKRRHSIGFKGENTSNGKDKE